MWIYYLVGDHQRPNFTQLLAVRSRNIASLGYARLAPLLGGVFQWVLFQRPSLINGRQRLSLLWLLGLRHSANHQPRRSFRSASYVGLLGGVIQYEPPGHSWPSLSLSSILILGRRLDSRPGRSFEGLPQHGQSELGPIWGPPKSVGQLVDAATAKRPHPGAAYFAAFLSVATTSAPIS